MGIEIKAVFQSLTQRQKEQLKCAHQCGVPQYFKLENNRFIGVYCNGVSFLKIEHHYNDWSIGRIEYPPINGG